MARDSSRTLVLSIAEVVKRFVRSRPRKLVVDDRREILPPPILVHDQRIQLGCVGSPSSPMPSPRPVAHQGPFVPAGRDEHIRALARHDIFHPPNPPRPLAIFGPGEVVVGFEMGQNARALVPLPSERVVLDERHLFRGAAAVATAESRVVTSGQVPVVLLELRLWRRRLPPAVHGNLTRLGNGEIGG